jgi:hypothetical protein
MEGWDFPWTVVARQVAPETTQHIDNLALDNVTRIGET